MNDIVNTLIIRDVKSRFYGHPLAYIWTLVNPLAWIGALIAFFSLVGKQVPIFTDIFSFLIPGMLSYILFRNTINSIMRTRKSTHAILPIATITPQIMLKAVSLAELLNGMGVFFVLIALNYILFEKLEYFDPLIMIWGYLSAWGTGLAMGSFFMELAQNFPVVEKILPLILRPVFWISGVFYTANELPEWLAQIGALNPLFQSIEIVRNGTFLSYDSRMVLYYEPIVFISLILSLSYCIRLYLQREK